MKQTLIAASNRPHRSMNEMNLSGDERPLVLEFDKVSFSYGDIRVFDHIAFHVHRGEFVALIGPNGAGKTTALKLVLGLLQPTDGKVRLFGTAAREGRSKIGYVPQHADFDSAFPITVREVVRMGRLKPLSRKTGREDREAAEAAMEKTGVLDLADRPYAALSGGQRRRVLVARALASEPELLILDEPTANMDAESEKRLFDTLGALKGNTTVLIVTHDSFFVSSLIDVVLCIGESGAACDDMSEHPLHRHRTAPAEAPRGRFGGSAARVLHDTEIPDPCSDCEVDK